MRSVNMQHYKILVQGRKKAGDLRAPRATARSGMRSVNMQHYKILVQGRKKKTT